MNNLAFIITGNAITITLNGHVNVVPRSAANAAQIIAELSQTNPCADTLVELISVSKAINGYSEGRVTIAPDSTVRLDGEPLPSILAERVLQCYDQGVPFAHLIRFFERLTANPSQRAVAELYKFLEHKSMPITPEGHILAYKGVQENYYSSTGNLQTKVLKGTVDENGRILNAPGEEVIVQRNHVDDDANVGCSKGLHAGSLEYATGFSERRVIVSVDPADVVSIPLDCSCQKLRCCRYKVLCDYKGKLADGGVRDERSPYVAFTPSNSYADPCPELDVSGFQTCCAEEDAEEAWENAVDQGTDDGDTDAQNGDPCDAGSWNREFVTRAVEAAYQRAYARGYAEGCKE